MAGTFQWLGGVESRQRKCFDRYHLNALLTACYRLNDAETARRLDQAHFGGEAGGETGGDARGSVRSLAVTWRGADAAAGWGLPPRRPLLPDRVSYMLLLKIAAAALDFERGFTIRARAGRQGVPLGVQGDSVLIRACIEAGYDGEHFHIVLSDEVDF
jgi:hypothetical protein